MPILVPQNRKLIIYLVTSTGPVSIDEWILLVYI